MLFRPPSKITLPIAPAAPPEAYAAMGFAIAVTGEAGKNLSITAPTSAAAPTPATTLPTVPRLNTFPILLLEELLRLVLRILLVLFLVDKDDDFRRLVGRFRRPI